jgi:hypothetical protein
MAACWPWETDVADEPLDSAFRASLNEQGHGFHHSLARHIQGLQEKGLVAWRVEAVEFPVELRGRPTHIDCVLRHRRAGAIDLRIVAECKRANPALSSWCFIRRSPESRHGRHVYAEQVRTTNEGNYARAVDLWPSDRVYDVALPIRNRTERGDAAGEGRDVIDKAVTQAMTGLSGLLEFIAPRRFLLSGRTEGHFARLLPVVFTTARLWTTDAALSDSDLLTGNVAATPLTERTWIWLEHVLSPGLRHGLPSDESALRREDLQDYLRLDYTRQVAVVTAAGVQEFLGMAVWDSIL